MSAWISAILYRQGPPPAVTTSSLADFLEQLIALDLRDESRQMGVELKFGRSIDQDNKGTYVYDDLNDTIVTIRPIAWDAQLETHSADELLEWLRSPFKKNGLFARTITNPTIYRATIDLGAYKEEVYQGFSRDNDDANQIWGMWLDNFSVSIAPVEITDPQGDGTVYMMGWINISASGNGYLSPWTYEETLARLKASQLMQRIHELCRSFWPVPPIQLTQENIEARKAMGHLWGGDDYDSPPDWRWAINESY